MRPSYQAPLSLQWQDPRDWLGAGRSLSLSLCRSCEGLQCLPHPQCHTAVLRRALCGSQRVSPQQTQCHSQRWHLFCLCRVKQHHWHHSLYISQCRRPRAT
ncbi:hypothetical protein AAY473_013803 [Plecturocebus cupreus]